VYVYQQEIEILLYNFALIYNYEFITNEQISFFYFESFFKFEFICISIRIFLSDDLKTSYSLILKGKALISINHFFLLFKSPYLEIQ
jgi:hypothetical protein